jgi:1-acyl-sn-glycerol-3-phosphate acyltransferase
MTPASAPLDPRRWYYRAAYLPWARALARYHRARLQGGPPPAGPCIYVALHGAGYLVLDLVVAGYLIAGEGWLARGAPRTPLRTVAAASALEKLLPGLSRAKQHLGLVDPSAESCLAVLARGEQLLVTPGGAREARPSRDFYRLRWAGRYGFAQLALATGTPLVPLAVVGGAEAYPGVRLGRRLSLWSPLPLPVRLDVALGAPIAVEPRPGAGRDLAAVKALHALAWERTQALYDAARARRGAPG